MSDVVNAVVLPVWRDEAADGPTNMAADELLAEEAARHGGLVMRLYSWAEPTVSLGAFQRRSDASACAAIAGLPVVRRPSGGGAIVHGTDLTYAAAVPKDHPWGATPQALYDALHAAMVQALAEVGYRARRHVPSAEDPPADALLCFSRRSPGDVVIAGRDGATAATDPKVMGSAQRRLGATVLQHGSLLLSACSRVAAPARHPGLAELPSSTPGGGDPDQNASALADRWTSLVAEALGIDRIQPPGTFREPRQDAIAVRAARFRDERWTSRR